MTPEEKFDNKIWEILQKIKEELLFNNTREINWKESKYNPDHKVFSFDRGEKAVLDKLEGMKAIEIKESIGVLVKLPEIGDPSYSTDEILALYKNGGISTQYLNLKVVQPKFDKIYNTYKEMNIEKKLKDLSFFRDSENKKEKWYQTGWGQILIGLIVLIIGAVILNLIDI